MKKNDEINKKKEGSAPKKETLLKKLKKKLDRFKKEDSEIYPLW